MRLPWLLLLGVITSLLDTAAIGLVVLLLQFAFGAVQQTDGYGVLGAVVAFAGHFAGGNGLVVGLLVVVVLVAQSASCALYEGLAAHVRLQAYQSYREAVFANWVAREWLEDQQRSPGALVNTIQHETWEAAEALFQRCNLVIAGSIAAVYLAVMTATSVLLTAIAALLTVGTLVLSRLLYTRLRRQGQRSVEQKEALARHFVGNLAALRTIKAFRAEPAVLRQSGQLSGALRATFASIVRLETFVKPIADAVNLVVLGAVLLAASWLDYPGAVVLAFVMVLYRAHPRLQEVHRTLGRIARLQPSVAAVAAQLVPAAEPQRDGERDFPGLQRELRLRNVRCGYRGGVPVLDGFDLTIARGSVTVVLGRSGIGKTTLVNLLLQFVRPERGELLVDGVPLADYTRESWLRAVAIAGQDVELIDGTILDNLLLGNTAATPAQIWSALEIAMAAEIVRDLPFGLQAEVGARGVSLSGGQRQRLCLARALLAAPQLLILDEASNALDPFMEQAIFERLRAARPELTLLVVAHRAAIALRADHVAVLANGRVAEAGAPAELLRRPDSMLAALTGPAPAPAAKATTAGGER